MTSPLVHHLPNWHVAGVITRPTDSDWWLWRNIDCGKQLWPVVWCRRIRTWLPLNLATLTLNPDNREASSTSFFLPVRRLCWPLAALILSITSLRLLSVLLMLQQKLPQWRASAPSADFLLSRSSAARERTFTSRFNLLVVLYSYQTMQLKAQHQPQLHVMTVFVVLGGWKWPLHPVWFPSKMLLWLPFSFHYCNWFFSFRFRPQSQPFLASACTVVELHQPQSLEKILKTDPTPGATLLTFRPNPPSSEKFVEMTTNPLTILFGSSPPSGLQSQHTHTQARTPVLAHATPNATVF